MSLLTGTSYCDAEVSHTMGVVYEGARLTSLTGTRTYATILEVRGPRYEVLTTPGLVVVEMPYLESTPGGDTYPASTYRILYGDQVVDLPDDVATGLHLGSPLGWFDASDIPAGARHDETVEPLEALVRLGAVDAPEVLLARLVEHQRLLKFLRQDH